MKILVLGNKRKYRGTGKGYKGSWYEELFREEFGRMTDSFFYGWGYGEKYGYEWSSELTVPEIIEKYYKPDVILTSDLNARIGLEEIKNVLKVHISGDFYEGGQHLKSYFRHFKHHKYDVAFGYATATRDYLRKNNVGKYQYILPFTTDINIYKKKSYILKDIDVSTFWGASDKLYPWRRIITKMIWDMDVTAWVRRVYYDDAVDLTNRSKICINCNSKFKFITPRVTETLACGTFLLTDMNDDLKKFGYIDGHHLVTFDSLEDLKDKIYYYVEHEDEREEIAKNGMDFVRENYNNVTRVNRFVDVVSKHLKEINI